MALIMNNAGGAPSALQPTFLEGSSITLDKDYSYVVVMLADNINGSTIDFTGSGTQEDVHSRGWSGCKAISNMKAGDVISVTNAQAHSWTLWAYCFE